MAFDWTPIAVSGFNASPPVDDGTVSEANKLKWSTIKSKLADPLNTWAASIDAALDALLDGTGVSLTGAETLTNKTLTLPIIASVSNSGTVTLPTGTRTLVARDTTDTLTNKTLTAPVIASIVNTGTLTLPTSTDTLVGKATTDTFTNKTLTAPVLGGSVTGTYTLAGTPTITNPTINAATLSGTVAASGTPTFSGTWANLGTVTTIDINGGTVDGATVGAASRSTGAFSYMAVGGATSTPYGLRVINGDLTGTGQYGVFSAIIGTSAATSGIRSFYSLPSTAAAVFTCTDVVGYAAFDATKGAGSTITDQFGFNCTDLTVGTNNYAFWGGVNSGANKWNAYMSGTAANHFGGTVFIGDTSNASSTLALTINQAGNDDEIFTCKSSDVAHGFTTHTETDSFVTMKKVAGASGGVTLAGWTEATIALALTGAGITDNTTKSTGGLGYVQITGGKQSGTAIGEPGTNANLCTIGSIAATRFIFDMEGSAHADVEWIAFDKYDDLIVLDGLNEEMQRRNGVQRAFGEWVSESRDILQREGVFNFYDEGPRAMMNMTKMHMLEVGAIRQLGGKLAAIENKLNALENDGR